MKTVLFLPPGGMVSYRRSSCASTAMGHASTASLPKLRFLPSQRGALAYRHFAYFWRCSSAYRCTSGMRRFLHSLALPRSVTNFYRSNFGAPTFAKQFSYPQIPNQLSTLVGCVTKSVFGSLSQPLQSQRSCNLRRCVVQTTPRFSV
jgi:hypothetical protein